MGSKNDYTQSRICNHHPETCTCRDEDDNNQLNLNPMSNTKIVIDKEHFDMFLSMVQDQRIGIKIPYTEIQID